MRERLKQKFGWWTVPYTILTVGSFISYMGNAAMSFVIDIMVLDLKQSVILYSVFLITRKISSIIVPLLVGPYLDRFSRKKVIYTMDFCSATIYATYGFFMLNGMFKLWMAFAGCILLGIIDSTYRVAFNSIYPMLVDKEHLQEAYSVASFLETVSNIMTPVAGVIYKFTLPGNSMILGAAIFLIAATTEIFIKVDEKLATHDKHITLKEYGRDMKEGFSFLLNEKAILFATLGYTCVYVFAGIQGAIWLPFFKSLDGIWGLDGYIWYIILTGAALGGNSFGSIVLFNYKLKPHLRYRIANLSLICSGFFGIISLGVFKIPFVAALPIWLPYIISAISMYWDGFVTAVNYNIMSASTYAYLKNEQRGRYSGIFHMLISAGTVLGLLIGGYIADRFSFMAANITGWFIAFCGIIVFDVIFGRKNVKMLYNMNYENADNTELSDTQIQGE